MKPEDWLPFPDPPGARLRLVCCAHSGAGIANFARWRRALPDGIALCPVRRPGRESAMRHPLLTSVAPIVDGVVAALATRPPMPTVMLGHSLGAIVAYEASRRLQTAGAPPNLLIASGRNGPQHPIPTDFGGLPDRAFIDAIRNRYGGIPAAVLASPELMALMLPILRADFVAAEDYQQLPGPVWKGPTWVIAGQRDPHYQPQQFADWRAAVDGPLAMDILPGGHFFPFEAESGYFAALTRRLGLELAAV